MSTGLKANSDGSAAIQVGGTDVITLTSGGAATFVTSPTTVQAGTAAAPSITFSGDTNTGIYSPGADTIAFTEGGVESMRIDSSGNVGIGTSSPGYTTSNRVVLQVNGATSSLIGLAYGGTNAGYLFASSSDTTLWSEGSRLLQIGTASAGPILFYTNNAERARFNAGAPILCLSGGNTSATGTGIAFPATQSASSDANTLDDYEEGTWTPAIAGGSGTTYTTQAGWYTKVGNLVTVGFDLNLNAKGTISGNAQITGLPFTSGSSPARAGGSLAVVNNTGTAYVFTAVFIDNGVTTMDIYIKTAAAISTTIPTGTSFFAAGTQLIASLSYRV